MNLTDAQITALLAPLDPGRVRHVQGNAHLEAWDERRWLLRIFGWGGFDIETLECSLVSERSVWESETSMKGRHSVVYRVQARLIIKGGAGQAITHFDDGATGASVNQPSLGDAHDQALKTAMSQALKRCCVNLGDQFGLSLYNGGRTMPVVGRSIAHAAETKHETAESVTTGEMDTDTLSAPMDSPPSVEPVEPPLAAPGSGSPSDSLPEGEPTASPEDVAAQIAAQVEDIRSKAVALLTGTKKGDALQHLTRLQLNASKAKLMNEPILSPKGEQMTVSVFLNEILAVISRSSS